MSSKPHIAEGIMLADGAVEFCFPGETPCPIGQPSGDGYLLQPPGDEETVRLRFEVLNTTGSQSVYIGEAEVLDDDRKIWSYLIARQDGVEAGQPARFRIVIPSCKTDAPSDNQNGFERVDAYSCEVTDLDAFKAFIAADYATKVSDPDWWLSGD